MSRSSQRGEDHLGRSFLVNGGDVYHDPQYGPEAGYFAETNSSSPPGVTVAALLFCQSFRNGWRQ